MARCWSALAVAVVALGCGDKHDTQTKPVAAPQLTKKAAPAAAAFVTISGSVIERGTAEPQGGIAVVLRGPAGDITTATNASGAFSVQVVPGSYRAFVRDDNVISIGLTERVRLDNMPRRELVGIPDEALMPVLDATANREGVELTVVRAATIKGVVYDPEGRMIANAVVRARQVDVAPAPPALGGNPLVRARQLDVGVRPVLGSDLGVSNEQGRFTLVVAPGTYAIDASHATFAGSRGTDVEVDARAGKIEDVMIGLERGCIISGRVVHADGSPANDGAIERLGSGRINDFGPAGRIDAGTFRWATTADESVTLRAWPWRSPPSQPKTFACSDGKRFNDVVLRLPDQRPDLSGTIVDARDLPVPLAYLDIQPLDPIVSGQQERGDSAGNWHVYDMPPARYRITATAPGLGIADTMVVSPRQDLRLMLGGTGRIVGTTTDLVTGSVEVSFLFCGSQQQPLQIAHEPRIVPVVGGQFTIERAPACTLSFAVRWRDKLIETTTVIEPDHTAYVEVELGEPRAKTVTGTVRDVAGNAVEGARVTAVLHDRETETARTDASGHYTLKTHSGAQLVAGKAEHVGRGMVGRANVSSEQIDLTLDDAGL
jgi:hypothetical protein